MVDLDGDGKPDLVSGSYAAKIFLWRGVGRGEFGPRQDLISLTDEAFKDGHVACHAVDWDGDGDIDFLAGSRRGFVSLVENMGSPKEPRFAAPVPVPVKGAPLKTPRGDAGPHAADWDGDGDLDLLVGDAAGRVTLFRNTGTRKSPHLEPGEELLPPQGSRFAEEPRPSGPTKCRGAELCAMRAKPWVVDWNGDGLPDLLVGDFHDHRTEALNGSEHMHGWVWLYLRRKQPGVPSNR